MEKIEQWTNKIRKIRVRKMHLDYLAGLLTLPVLLTAILINLGNLHKTDSTPAAPTPTSMPSKIIFVTQADKVPIAGNSATPTISCIQNIGPISITSPTEGQVVNDNPVCVNISYTNSNYCGVVWSYRINNGAWSDFNNNNPCLYNLPAGPISFQLKVNSTTTSNSETLVRNFTYSSNGSIVPSPTSMLINTPTPTTTIATQSAN